MSTRYLDPKNDISFRKIFGTEKHKRIPIDFLNAVFHFEEQDKIINLEFLNTKQPPEIEARKESVVDVMAEDQKGSRYIIEMQVAKIEGFEKRAQFYAAKTYCSHFKKGHKYHDLKKVIFLAITDYVVFPQKADYISHHVILDNKTYEHDLKDFSFTFVELPKFVKALDELETIDDRWYYFLKHADESSNIAEVLSNHPEINEAYDILDRYHWNESELHLYEKAIMNIADAMGMLDAAKNDGMLEGILEDKKRVAKKMLIEGYSASQASNISELSLAEIEKLLSEENSSWSRKTLKEEAEAYDSYNEESWFN